MFPSEERIKHIWPKIQKKDPQSMYEYGLYLERLTGKGPQYALQYYVSAAIQGDVNNPSGLKGHPYAAYEAGRIYATVPALLNKEKARAFLEYAKSANIPEAENMLNKMDEGLTDTKQKEWDKETQKEYDEGKRTEFPINQRAYVILNTLARDLNIIGEASAADKIKNLFNNKV